MNKVLQHSSLTFALAVVTALAVQFPATAQNTSTSDDSRGYTGQTKPAVKVRKMVQPGSANHCSGKHDTVEYKDPEDMTTRYQARE